MKKLNFGNTQARAKPQSGGKIIRTDNLSQLTNLLTRFNNKSNLLSSSSSIIEERNKKKRNSFQTNTFYVNDTDRGEILSSFGEKTIRNFCATKDSDQVGKVKKDKGIEILIKLLSRKVLYIGSECEKLGKINITKEYDLISKILSDSFITIKKVERPNISNIVSEWDLLKPSIIFISCHGDEMGLYLEDDDGKCYHYRNVDFVKFFRKRSIYTECVILSSCESLNLGESISNEGKKVICINKKIDINTTIEFNKHFFEYINDHSLEASSVYKNAFDLSMEIIAFAGLKDSFSFKFIDANKIG
jgi:hypothetical protein